MQGIFRALGAAAFIMLMQTTGFAQGAYDVAALDAFRKERQRVLLADDGWFTVAGLHFLSPGENRFGSDPLGDVVLDFADVPAQAGVITMNGTTVTIRAAEGKTLIYNGKPATDGPLRLAASGRPADTVTYGGMTFFLHYSGPRLAIRVRDQKAPLRTNFKTFAWYPANPSVRVVGTFTPAATKKVVQAPNILGDLEPFDVAGTVAFSLGGQTHTMEAWESGNQLWFVFRDRTSADATYPSARFLYTEQAKEGRVVMDFNYARNPPCAYNPWTTCPLPPAPNRLPVRIEAGELRYPNRGSSSVAPAPG